MVTVISDTHSLVTGKPGAQETVAPGNPAEVSQSTADALVRRGIARLREGGKLPPADDTEKVSEGTGELMTESDTAEGDSLNLNTASAPELTTIKGVGKKTAGDIVASREADGPFESLADCAERVGGVSLEQLEAAGATV